MLTNLPTYFSQIDHLNTSQIALRIWPISGLGLILGAVIAGRFLRKWVTKTTKPVTYYVLMAPVLSSTAK